MLGSGRRTIRRRPRVARRLRALHRWLGLGAAIFLLLLCVTGVALNHTGALGLDARFIGQAWLLDWYGIRGPSLGPSFAIGERWVTQAEDRLFLDATEVDAGGLGSVVGAAPVGGEIAVVTGFELLLLSEAGEVVERSPLVQSLPSPVDAAAGGADELRLRSGGQVFRYDPADGSLSAAGGEPDWAEPATLPPDLGEQIEIVFRGRGLSLERVLTDLHSGRLFGLSGALFNDLVALALTVLALSGIWLFIRR